MEMERSDIVGVGDFKLAGPGETLGCIGLGSCIGIILHDRFTRFGGIAHAMLPFYEEGRDRSRPAKYVDTAVYVLIDALVEKGVTRRNINAKLVGGASMFSFRASDILDIGNRNIRAAHRTIEVERIRLLSEDVGGNHGRTITLDMDSGAVTIRTSRDEHRII